MSTERPDISRWLHDLLQVEAVEDNFFRGMATPQGRGRSFGGQVIGQALKSAIKTVGDDRPVHSLHAYFMRPGDATKPVLYRVERDRDGRSFATRRVIAVQSGKPILNLAASFHVREEGYSQQITMPDVPGPEGLENETELGARFADQIPESYCQWLKAPKPVEMRAVGLRAPFSREPRDPVQYVWMRSRGDLGANPSMHRAALAYASDFNLLGTAVLPWAKAFADPDMQFASLDHAVWFHQDFEFGDWHLYAMDAPWTGGARGLNRGQIFSRDGRLVASTAQEGLVRPVTPRES
ncbi:acyl-CoA thioesterase II [Thalassobius sp. Cn5-15]|uniref:acyl-CoA thioesterase n=1 Tax=Thalassobius sp. Cn5-15 TaxID=2917763 RepID=UPI001EF2BDF9|nr:acyl-CoA thioesterase II [Thalassobius sp. Cn5-15]MCG7493823.1 acyl-CoA thioesterase II [Thalassobius sp. Cn5-15]